MAAPMSAGTRWGLTAFVLFTCVGCDQWTKKLATEHLQQVSAPIRFLGDTLRIQYAENPGAFLGAGANLPAPVRFWILVVINAVFLAVIAILTAVAASRTHLGITHTIAAALLLAGGLGNLVDRIFHNGLVVDFLNLGIGQLRTGIFNVADMAIMAGFAILIFQHRPAPAQPGVESMKAEG
jgi:signal peptidase II